MERNRNIHFFLPSGCITLEGLQEFQKGSCSEGIRQEIKQHLKECRFCMEAYEGLALIPNPLEQKEMIQNLGREMKTRIHSRQETSTRLNLFHRKSNMVALAASIIFLVGVFSIYSYLLKKDHHYYALKESSEASTDSVMSLNSLPVVKPLLKEEKELIPKKKENNEKANKTISGVSAKINAEATTEPTVDNIYQPIVKVQDSGKFITLNNEIGVEIAENANNMDEQILAIKGTEDLSKISSKKKPMATMQKSLTRTEAVKGASLIKADEQAYQLARFENANYVDFKDYLSKNLQYPDSLRKARIQGTVLIECTITRNGTVKNCKIIQKVDSILDNEALRVLRNSPRWIPAKKEGTEVAQKLVIPVLFSLSDSLSAN